MRMNNRLVQHLASNPDKTASRGSIQDKIKTIRHERLNAITVKWNPGDLGPKYPVYDVVRELDKDLAHAYQTEILDHALELFKVWVDDTQDEQANFLFGKGFCMQSRGLPMRANLNYKYEISVFTIVNNGLLFKIAPSSESPTVKTQQKIQAFFHELVKLIPLP